MDVFEQDFERQLLQLKNSVEDINQKFLTTIDNATATISSFGGTPVVIGF